MIYLLSLLAQNLTYHFSNAKICLVTWMVHNKRREGIGEYFENQVDAQLNAVGFVYGVSVWDLSGRRQ